MHSLTQRTTPKENRSTASVQRLLVIISGAMSRGPAGKSSDGPAELAKSTSFKAPSTRIAVAKQPPQPPPRLTVKGADGLGCTREGGATLHA